MRYPATEKLKITRLVERSHLSARQALEEPTRDQIDRPIGQFAADGAYDGNPTYDVLTNHSPDAAARTLILGAADGSRPRLRRPQSPAGMRMPEIRPVQNSDRRAAGSMIVIRSH